MVPAGTSRTPPITPRGSLHMPKHVRRWAVLVAVFVAQGVYSSLAAQGADAPRSEEIKSVAVHPAKVALTGSDDAAQLVVTATLANGQLADLTPDATYAVADGKIGRASCRERV